MISDVAFIILSCLNLLEIVNLNAGREIMAPYYEGVWQIPGADCVRENSEYFLKYARYLQENSNSCVFER